MQHTLYIAIQQYEHSVNFGVEIWTRALSAQSRGGPTTVRLSFLKQRSLVKKKIIMLIQQKQCSACKHLEENISFGNIPLNFFL